MKQAEVATVYDEPRRASVGLYHIAEFRVGILKPGGRMGGDGVH